MKSILVELTCTQCMFHTYRKSETLILSDFEIQGREQLLNDTFFTFQCPRCGHLIEFIHPLAYIDKDHKFVLYIKSKKDFKESDHALYKDDVTSRKRYISNHNEIAEKIRIFEDDLDDRCIEIIKFKLVHHLEKQKQKKCSVTYFDYDAISQTIWFRTTHDKEQQMLAVLMDEYLRLVSTMLKERHDYYSEVNAQWVFDNFIK
ncbi:MAG: CpXC domain-containing protein [Longicatena sp.]